MRGGVQLAKVNIDENRRILANTAVAGTIAIVQGRQWRLPKIGALPKSKLYEWVESVL